MEVEVFVTPLFDREISYLHYDLNETRTQWGHFPIKKVATFKELSRVDRSQAKLSMAVASAFRKFPRVPVFDETGKQKTGEDGKLLFTMSFDEEIIYDITSRFISDMTVLNSVFGEQERAELLNDAGAVLMFGWWLLEEKLLPFFQHLLQT